MKFIEKCHLGVRLVPQMRSKAVTQCMDLSATARVQILCSQTTAHQQHNRQFVQEKLLRTRADSH
jgi:hypothetical protein